MPLSVIHDTIDDIPEQYRELYTEKEGKFLLTGIAGVKTQADIDRLQGALTKERDDHKAAKNALGLWTGLGFEKPEELQGKLDRYNELEVAAGAKQEEIDAQLEKLTEARVGSRLAPVQRELDGLKSQLEAATEELTTLRGEKRRRIIGDFVTVAAKEANVLADAYAGADSDVLMAANVAFDVTEDGQVLTKEDNPFGIPGGLTPDLFLTQMQSKRSHWWPASQGGGATGGKGGAGVGDNPFSAENWNLTKQGELIRTHGMEKAKQLAALAGTTVGGKRPAAKQK